MGDLISRSRLKEELKSWAWIITKPQYYHREDADFVIDSQPTIDAVEVVRCKDCRHSDYIDYTLYCYECDRNTNEDDYCSKGC